MPYAANDPYASFKVLEALKLPREELRIMGSNQPEQNPDKTNSLE